MQRSGGPLPAASSMAAEPLYSFPAGNEYADDPRRVTKKRRYQSVSPLFAVRGLKFDRLEFATSFDSS